MANAEWWMAVGGHQVGPVTEAEIVANIKNGSVDEKTLVFTAGMDAWTPLRDVDRFRVHLGSSAPPPLARPTVPGRRANEIDFRIVGEDMQFVEVELDPGETVVAEAGVMMYMTSGIGMETIFGDGSASTAAQGIVGALLGAGRRILTGESLFMTLFTNQAGSGKERVAFAAPYPGRIQAVDLAKMGGELICQKDSFLCAARGVAIGVAFQKRMGVGLFGGEGFIMQSLTGDGLCFIHSGGMVTTMDLGPGEVLRVDTGCLVALAPSVSYDIQFVGNVKTALFGGEGIFFATLTGPGRVWLQSLPFSRIADRIYKAAPQAGGKRKEEGSVLDAALGLGRMIDRD